LTPADAVAMTAPQSFDISIWQMLAPLLAGARVEIFAEEIAFDPSRLLEAAAERAVTVLELVPSALRAALDHARHVMTALAPERLRWLILTGETLPPDLCRAWFAYRPDIPIVNAYGPSECTDNVTHHVVTEPPAPEDPRVPIGHALPNLRLYVLDDSMQPVAPGLIGELFIGGAGVGNGYIGKPALTANAFVPDPFSDLAGARLYRTGDRVRQRPDGSVDFMGRRDHQVKIRGHRIEPDEVRAVLAEQPGVRDCAVIARNGILVAYVVGDEQAPPATAALRAALQPLLPEYMVPGAFVLLDALPLTPNGKLNRAALPDLPAARPEVTSAYEAPATPLEERLTAIWEELLGLGRLGVQDNFFELGGHSLLAMRLMSRINETFGVDLSLRQVFDLPTISGLASAIVEAQLDGMSENELDDLLDGLESPPGGKLFQPKDAASIAPAMGDAV
jgi:acyl-coenzyme A synthetase/AMP-(fatty) acid ligase/acyl carrier protein